MKKRILRLIVLLALLVFLLASGQEEEPASPEAFVPSEEITADSAISFPVDI